MNIRLGLNAEDAEAFFVLRPVNGYVANQPNSPVRKPYKLDAYQVKYNLIWEQLYYGRKRTHPLSQTTGAKNATAARAAAYAAANAAESKKANGTVVLDVKQVTTMAEFFVITGGDSPAQIRAIVDAVDDALSELGYKHGKVEGRQDGRWVLIDFGDVIIHVLHEKERSFYKLEQFWNHALIVQKDEWDADKNG